MANKLMLMLYWSQSMDEVSQHLYNPVNGLSNEMAETIF